MTSDDNSDASHKSNLPTETSCVHCPLMGWREAQALKTTQFVEKTSVSYTHLKAQGKQQRCFRIENTLHFQAGRDHCRGGGGGGYALHFMKGVEYSAPNIMVIPGDGS